MEQKKKALGRGLEELFSTEVLDFDTFENNVIESATENDIKEIPVGEIRPNPYQPRKTFNDDALKELSESIKNYSGKKIRYKSTCFRGKIQDSTCYTED